MSYSQMRDTRESVAVYESISNQTSHCTSPLAIKRWHKLWSSWRCKGGFSLCGCLRNIIISEHQKINVIPLFVLPVSSSTHGSRPPLLQREIQFSSTILCLSLHWGFIKMKPYFSTKMSHTRWNNAFEVFRCVIFIIFCSSRGVEQVIKETLGWGKV